MNRLAIEAGNRLVLMLFYSMVKNAQMILVLMEPIRMHRPFLFKYTVIQYQDSLIKSDSGR